jgi:hypothetical protein
MRIILVILSVLLVTAGWIAYRRCGRSVFKRLLAYAAIVAALLTGLGAWGYHELKKGYAINTSANAASEDVGFLRLPATASHIGFWRDGINYWAEFNVSEEDFKQLFLKFQFGEITQPLELMPKKFGNPKVFPTDSDLQPVIITNGLRHHERWDNGGGYTITYDRPRSRAYYDFAKR